MIVQISKIAIWEGGRAEEGGEGLPTSTETLEENAMLKTLDMAVGFANHFHRGIPILCAKQLSTAAAFC